MIKISYYLKYELNNEKIYGNISLISYPTICQFMLKGEQIIFKYLAKHMLKVNNMTDYLTKFNKKLKQRYIITEEH